MLSLVLQEWGKISSSRISCSGTKSVGNKKFILKREKLCGVFFREQREELMVVLEFLKAIIINFWIGNCRSIYHFYRALIFRVNQQKHSYRLVCRCIFGRFLIDHRGIYTNHHTIGTKYVEK